MALSLLLSSAVAARQPSGPSGAPGSFEISGAVEGLYPAVDGRLSLNIENRHAFALVVETLDVGIGDASAACDGSNLVVGNPALPVLVPAGSEIAVPLVVSLTDDAPDGCQSATWPLSYTATASKGASGGGRPDRS